MCVETIRADDVFRQRVRGRGILVDLRSREEYQRGHIPGAVSVPYVELEARMKELQALAESRTENGVPRTVILYCSRGNASLLAARKLHKSGFRVKSIYGGIHAYRGPLARGREGTTGRR